MQSTPPAGELSSAILGLVLQFENAWEAGRGRPAIEDYLPADGPARWEALRALVRVDLERRLRTGERVRAENYVQRYPELASDPAAMCELIEAEYWVRWDSEPGLAAEE